MFYKNQPPEAKDTYKEYLKSMKQNLLKVFYIDVFGHYVKRKSQWCVNHKFYLR